MSRKKIWFIFLGILILAVLAGLIDWPKGPDIRFKNPFTQGKEFYKELKLHLGLDLQGGTHLVYEADLSRVEPANYEEAMTGVRDVIERRVNALGVSEPVVQTNKSDGHWRVIIELAGVFDINEAIKMIGQTPSLDFREETEEGKEIAEGLHVEGKGKEAKIVDEEGKPVDVEKLKAKLKEKGGFPGFKMTKLTGQHLTQAQLRFDPQTNQPVVGLKFNEEGKKLFAEITERNLGKPLAIFLDGQMISAPVVRDVIRNGEAVISGNFSIDEARQLARRLNAGALPVPINLVSQTNVGAGLGKASVEKSFFAALIGLALLALFMIIYYRFPGFLAVIALGIYILIVLALFKLIPITLTLAGIAGFILSIGMAVDANVLIFERFKEERRQGKSLESAIDDGFVHAWSSIRDANVSTLISCLILAWFGTSIIKGFAITLGIGVLVSMFSAITVTKTFLKLFAPYLKKWKRLF